MRVSHFGISVGSEEGGGGAVGYRVFSGACLGRLRRGYRVTKILLDVGFKSWDFKGLGFKGLGCKVLVCC